MKNVGQRLTFETSDNPEEMKGSREKTGVGGLPGRNDFIERLEGQLKKSF